MKNEGCLLRIGEGGWILTDKVCEEIRKCFVDVPLIGEYNNCRKSYFKSLSVCSFIFVNN